MTTTIRRGILAIVTGLVLLALGAGVGIAVGDTLGIHTEPAEVDPAMVWFARVLLVLALAWVVIGMLSARTRLVRRPGAAAARATWLSSLRPWRARESSLGLFGLDKWLIFAVPVALLIATRLVQTSLIAWVPVFVILAAWVVFALVVRLFVGRRSPWPVIAAVGGVVVLRCILTLIALAFTGPGGVWNEFLANPVLRVGYIAIAFALFVWVFVVAGWTLSTQLGVRRATGAVLTAVGAGAAIPAVIVALVGLESALTEWNSRVGLFSWSLSQIADITTDLGIPDAAAWYAAGLGAVVAVVGVLLALPSRRHAASDANRPDTYSI